MIKAIVYTSNTGFTKKYAEMLGKETQIPVYELKKAKKEINKNDEVIYMGWLMAGKIKNYEKAKKRYKIKIVCAVGMISSNEKQYNEVKEKHKIEEKFFYLQGGFNKDKLNGLYKFMMSSMERIIKPQLEAKENKTKDELEMLEMMNTGKDCVKKENLKDILELIKNRKQ